MGEAPSEDEQDFEWAGTWIAASRALDLVPGVSLDKGASLIRAAAGGLIAARTRYVSGANWLNLGRWFFVNRAFWELIENGNHKSDWLIGEFQYPKNRRVGDRSNPIVIKGVEFEEAEFRRAFGLETISTTPATQPMPNASEDRSKDPKPRRRNGQWDDWIAYLAGAIYDGAIQPNATETEALKIIADRMAADDIGEMPRANVQSAINRALEMMRKLPAD